MTNIDTTVGSNIKRLREQSGLNQNTLARYLGIDQSTISKIESGDRSIGVSLLEQLCNLFFCSMDDLLAQPKDSNFKRSIAYRTKDLNEEDLEAVAAVGRIVRNLEDMSMLEKAINAG